MLDEKRTFETKASGVRGLEFRSRPTRREEIRFADPQYLPVDDAQVPRDGYNFPREVILRLIDWLRDE